MKKRTKRNYSVEFEADYRPGEYGEIKLLLIGLPHPFSRPIVLKTCFDYVENNGKVNPVIFLDSQIRIEDYHKNRTISSSLSPGQRAVLELIVDKISRRLPDNSKQYIYDGIVSVATNLGTSIGLEGPLPIRGRLREKIGSSEDF